MTAPAVPRQQWVRLEMTENGGDTTKRRRAPSCRPPSRRPSSGCSSRAQRVGSATPSRRSTAKAASSESSSVGLATTRRHAPKGSAMGSGNRSAGRLSGRSHTLALSGETADAASPVATWHARRGAPVAVTTPWPSPVPRVHRRGAALALARLARDERTTELVSSPPPRRRASTALAPCGWGVRCALPDPDSRRRRPATHRHARRNGAGAASKSTTTGR